jgi:ATP-dependent RNA helicase RhlE
MPERQRRSSRARHHSHRHNDGPDESRRGPSKNRRGPPHAQRRRPHEDDGAPKQTRSSFPGQPSTPQGVFKDLIEPLQRAISEEGYTQPTPIQTRSIPHLVKGRDLLGIAQTGTGKTAAFTLPLLQELTRTERRSSRGRPRALILAPTRELAAQIGESIKTYGRHLRVRHTVIFGGVSQGAQVNHLHRGLEIVVATPGRLLDLMQQGHVHLDEVDFFVLDEVDRMLDMGFINDIRRVLAKLPDDRQTLFFSATMPTKVNELARTMVRDPIEVSIAPEKLTVDKVLQQVLFVDKKKKIPLLIDILRDESAERVIIFTQMKHVASKVARKLDASGITASSIHGDKSQNARTSALDRFKKGRVRALVATDVAARGIDVEGITHVINYDLPNQAEVYVHRIGRTARAGAGGVAISFCSAEEREFLRDIERLIKTRVPSDKEHRFHSEEAMRATGDAAKPPPKTPRPPRSPSRSRPQQDNRGRPGSRRGTSRSSSDDRNPRGGQSGRGNSRGRGSGGR